MTLSFWLNPERVRDTSLGNDVSAGLAAPALFSVIFCSERFLSCLRNLAFGCGLVVCFLSLTSGLFVVYLLDTSRATQSRGIGAPWPHPLQQLGPTAIRN
jgi:hypothetical protein